MGWMGVSVGNVVAVNGVYGCLCTECSLDELWWMGVCVGIVVGVHGADGSLLGNVLW